MLHEVALVNESTVVSDDELRAIARSLEHQVNHDYRPIWGTNASVMAVPKGSRPAPGVIWLVVLDNMDQAGALGYHDLTPDHKPIGKVGAKTDLEYGALVSVTCSHELLEILGDPLINLLVEDPTTGRIYAFENCDAVEADNLGYNSLGIQVSDFVLPSFFDPNRAGKGDKLSFCGHVTEPFSLAPGGYLSFREVGASEWQQVTAEGIVAASGIGKPMERQGPGERAPGFPDGSRRERRLRASRGELVVSTVRPGA